MSTRSVEIFGWAMAIAVMVLLSSCDETKTPTNQVLVKVNGTELTAGQYRDQRFFFNNILSKLQIKVPEQRIQAMIESELLYQEAKKEKLDEEPDLQAQIKTLLINQLLRREILKKKTLPSEAEALKYFRDHAERFQSPETVHYAHILLHSPDKKADLALGRRILNDPRLLDSTHFNELAAEHSVDKITSSSGGDLGSAIVPDGRNPISGDDHTWQLNLIKAAAAIKDIGGIYPELVETERGYHIVKLLGHEPARGRTYEEVRSQVMRQMAIEGHVKAYQEFLAQLRSQADVQIDQTQIDSLAKAGQLTIPDRPVSLPGELMPGQGLPNHPLQSSDQPKMGTSSGAAAGQNTAH